MSYGNLRARPDLRPIFGAIPHGEQSRLIEELLRIDDRLKSLAREAAEHIGVAYEHTGLGLFSGDKYSEIAGGPSGNAGDIWFEVGYTFDEAHKKWRVPPWEVDSRIIVFCADLDPTARGYSCTHDLVSLRTETDTPELTVRTLAAHVEALAAEIRKRERSAFTSSLHAELTGGEKPG